MKGHQPEVAAPTPPPSRQRRRRRREADSSRAPVSSSVQLAGQQRGDRLVLLRNAEVAAQGIPVAEILTAGVEATLA
jgi:hypothetical protein